MGAVDPASKFRQDFHGKISVLFYLYKASQQDLF